MVQNKEFREDLYYRLNVIEIELTPLKERPKDILPLIYYYLNKFNTKFGYSRQFSEECLNTLEQYNWPGNVRELRNVVERLIVTVDQQIIDTHHLPKKFQQTSKFKYKKTLPTSLDAAKDQIENDLITKAYEKHGSSRKVAKALEISQSRASRLIRKYVTN